MLGNYYITNLSIIAIIVGLIMLQIQFFGAFVEAKHYSQPYGDILHEEDENIYQNSFDARIERNRFDNKNIPKRGSTSQETDPYSTKYQSEYAASGVGRRRGEREKTQYQNFESTNYNRNNRNLGRNNPNGWMVASSIVEEQSHDNMTVDIYGDPIQHKCHIWVP